MKGKIAFVLGAAVGYVLGSRAGRERYEQIKRGAQSVWNTEPVQRGVGIVRSAAQTRVDELKATAVRVGKSAVVALARDNGDAGSRGAAAARTGAAPATETSADGAAPTDATVAAAKASAAKSASDAPGGAA